jgi:hypothetical protein
MRDLSIMMKKELKVRFLKMENWGFKDPLLRLLFQMGITVPTELQTFLFLHLVVMKQSAGCAALPHLGKTTALCIVAAHAISRGKNVLVVADHEMDLAHIRHRLRLFVKYPNRLVTLTEHPSTSQIQSCDYMLVWNFGDSSAADVSIPQHAIVGVFAGPWASLKSVAKVIRPVVVPCSRSARLLTSVDKLQQLFERELVSRVVVFAGSDSMVEATRCKVMRVLKDVDVACVHSGKSNRLNVSSMRQFCNMKCRVLVTSDTFAHRIWTTCTAAVILNTTNEPLVTCHIE